jgi:hypothetical protein
MSGKRDKARRKAAQTPATPNDPQAAAAEIRALREENDRLRALLREPAPEVKRVRQAPHWEQPLEGGGSFDLYYYEGSEFNEEDFSLSIEQDNQDTTQDTLKSLQATVAATAAFLGSLTPEEILTRLKDAPPEYEDIVLRKDPVRRENERLQALMQILLRDNRRLREQGGAGKAPLPSTASPKGSPNTRRWTHAEDSRGHFSVCYDPDSSFVWLEVFPESAGDELLSCEDLKLAVAEAAAVLEEIPADELLRHAKEGRVSGDDFLFSDESVEYDDEP